MSKAKDNENINPNDWTIEGSLGREERLISYIYTIRSKTKEPREFGAIKGKN